MDNNKRMSLDPEAAARVARDALRFSSAALTIGAVRIAALCESIERADEARSERLVGLLRETAAETGRAVQALIAL